MVPCTVYTRQHTGWFRAVRERRRRKFRFRSIVWFFCTLHPRSNCGVRVLFGRPRFSIERSVSKHGTNVCRAAASPSVRFRPFKRRRKQSTYEQRPCPSVRMNFAPDSEWTGRVTTVNVQRGFAVNSSRTDVPYTRRISDR